MTITSWLRRAAAISVCLAVLTPTAASLAVATPSDGISGVTLSQTTIEGRDYLLREITIEPGGSTGWHWHDGTVFGVVRAGTLTHNRADCSLDGVYGPGDQITEPGGPAHVHIGRNLGPTPVVMQAVYLLPIAAPLMQDAPDPGCGYS
ncbi:cupin domain-containing protein [Mycolicibacter arupensis]|jgi:quercetin dioxygenase-like cupin family protein|uniref:Cupin domain-containing protein n=1 Tax=Mycolicibacter arupensis TaxID=342002 RepID=A0A5C7XSH3_9MYCO|nr:cupin domain-containing protein [Mycolicibacter arupensis]TXI52459.1 MAG: cupin domain-containing protein [Mycolicibacter arupensis]